MTKEDLQSYHKLKIEAAVLSEEMRAAKRQARAEDGAAAQYLSETAQRYERLIDKTARRRAEIEAAVARLPDPIERTVLRCRYIYGYPWNKICIKTSYEWAQIHRIHSRALEHISEYGNSFFESSDR